MFAGLMGGERNHVGLMGGGERNMGASHGRVGLMGGGERNMGASHGWVGLMGEVKGIWVHPMGGEVKEIAPAHFPKSSATPSVNNDNLNAWRGQDIFCKLIWVGMLESDWKLFWMATFSSQSPSLHKVRYSNTTLYVGKDLSMKD